VVVGKRVERSLGGIPNKPVLEFPQKVKVFLIGIAQDHEIPNLGKSKGFEEIGFRVRAEILLFP